MTQKGYGFVGIAAYICATLFLFYEMALQVSPSVMDHYLMRDLQIGAQAFGIMSAWYFYSYTIMQIPAGMLYDTFSPKYLIAFFCSICGIGAVFFGMTETLLLASLGRFLMGIGSAFAFIGVLVCAHKWFAPRYFASLVGLAQLLAALGAIGGELPLSHYVNAFGWRDVMISLGYIGIAFSVVCFFVITHPPKDINSETKQKKFSFLAELLAILKSWQTFFIAVYAFCSWSPVAIFAALWGVPYLMRVYSITNTSAAFLVAFVWLGIAIAAPLLGSLSDVIKRRTILLTLCALVGFVSSTLLLLFDLPIYLVAVLLFMMGIASSGQILTFALVQDISKPQVVGTAIGINNMAVVAGGAIFQPLVGTLLSLLWTGVVENGVPVYDIWSFSVALSTVPLCYFVGLCTAVFGIKETYASPKYR